MKKLKIGFSLILCALLVSSLFGCSNDEDDYDYGVGLVGDLYRACFQGNDECDLYEYELLVHLLTSNGPNPDYSYPFLSVSDRRGAGGALDRISFEYYEYEDIPSGAGFPGPAQPGWKVFIPEAYISFCTTCYTDGGLAKLISLFGPRELVEFVWDPEDTLETYFKRALIESSTPAE